MTSRSFLVAAGMLLLSLCVSALLAASTQAHQPVAALNATSEPGWPLRRAIRIDNTQNSNALSNYQVKVVLDGSNFDFARADPSGADLRFSDDDGRTVLFYWLQ